MMKTMYYTTVNNGDGSSSVEFFYDRESIELLEEHDPETYSGGEGGGSFQYSGDLVFAYEWLEPQTLEQVKADILGGEEEED